MRRPKVEQDLCPGDVVCVTIAPEVLRLTKQGWRDWVTRKRQMNRPSSVLQISVHHKPRHGSKMKNRSFWRGS